MPDPIPTLSELSQGNTDAEIGTGKPANVINNQIVADGLMKAAQFRAESQWTKYTTALQNFKDVFKEASDIAGLDVMQQDKPELQKGLADVLGKITQDPKGALSGNIVDIKKGLIGLRGKANLSKQHNAWDQFNREYLVQNPDIDTPDNRKKIEDYGNTPIAERKTYLLDHPAAFDFNTFKTGILKQATTGVTNDEVGGVKLNLKGEQEFDVTGKGYIRTTTGNLTSKDTYNRLWDAGWETEHDQYGKPLKDIVTKQYNDLANKNPDIKKQFPSAFEYYQWLGRSSFGSDNDIQSGKTVKLSADPNLKNAEDLKLNWYKAYTDRDKGKAQIDYWKSKTTGSKQSKRDALNFATNLYNQISSVGDKGQDGVTIITPDQLRQLTAEQLKYLGAYGETSETNTPGKTVTNKGLLPIKLNPEDVLQLDDGKIQVLRNAHYENGKWKGKFDNTATTTLSNIATNRINEENQLSGGNEVNGYVDIDNLGADNSPDTKNSTESSGFSKKSEDDSTPKQVDGTADISKLSDGDYIISSGTNQGKTVTIKDGAAISIK